MILQRQHPCDRTHVPMRVCAACRERHPAEELLRFVRSGTRVSADLSRVAPGRGLNISPKRRCFELAIKRGVFRRSLGVTEPIELTTLCGQLVDELERESIRCLRAQFGEVRVPKRLDESVSGEALQSFLQGFSAPDFPSKRLSKRFTWLRECLGEFTSIPASASTSSFAPGNVIEFVKGS